MKPVVINTCLLLALILAPTTTIAETSPTKMPSPAELYERAKKEMLPPFSYKIVSDKVVPSDTDPSLKLRRIEVRFISQVVDGRKMGHDAVIFMPADPKVNAMPKRRGKVVIVARNFTDKTLIGNCAEPIAARTGYPTMCVVIPGDQDGKDGEMPWLTGLRRLARDTQDPINHDLFRCAVPYLRAIDVFADILGEKNIRAIIGGHSKRAYYAYTAAAIDPRRVASVVYMGCERLFSEEENYPDSTVSPPFAQGEKYPRCLVLFTTQKYVKCPVFYLGATNEAGFTMFHINKLVAKMKDPWTIEYIPNYRHASRSEKQLIDWQMWVAHVFDGRPIAKISDLRVDIKNKRTTLRASVQSENKILQAKAWYVYCDDVPYWRDLMWYPALMRKTGENQYVANVGGNPPDAWFVEVKDIGQGFSGYVSSLPQNITGKPAAERNARRPRNWELRNKKNKNVTPSPEAYRHYLDGQKYHHEGKRQKAITSYEKAIEIDPRFAMALWKLGTSIRQNDLPAFKKKSELLERAMNLSDRLSARDHLAVQGDYYSMSRYRYDRAIKVFNHWLKLFPSDVDAHRGLGDVYFDIEEWEKAASQYQFIIQHGKPRPGLYLKLAMAYINPGMYDEAETTLKQCLDRHGNNVKVYLSLSTVYQYRGDFDSAHKVVDRAIALYPQVAACYERKANIDHYRGDFDKAESRYRKLLEDPRPEFRCLGLYRMSELRFLQGRFKEARGLATQGYEYAKKNESPGMMRDRLSLLAVLDIATGNHQKALERQDILWKTTIEDEELEWQRFIIYCKGLIRARTGQIERAVEEANKLSVLLPQGMDKKKERLLLHLLGVIELERKNYRKAIEHLEKCLPMICLRSRLNTAVADSLAKAYFGMGDFKKAREQYERMAVFPRGRQYYGDLYALRLYHLGECYEAESNKAKAVECYQKFFDIWSKADPEIAELKSASRKLDELKD